MKLVQTVEPTEDRKDRDFAWALEIFQLLGAVVR